MVTEEPKTYVQVPPEQIGLDRSAIHSDGKIELAAEKNGRAQPLDAGLGNSTPDITQTQHIEHIQQTPTKEEPPKRKRSIFKRKLQPLKPNRNMPPSPDSSPAPILADSTNEISGLRYTADKPKPDNQTLKSLVHNPVDTVSSKVTSKTGNEVSANLVAKEIPHGQEVELVQADDAVQRARNETERLMRIEDVKHLMQTRQDMFVRWTVDRHVSKVWNLPEGTVGEKERKDFMKKGEDGKAEMDWLGYAEYLVRYNAEKYGGEYIGYISNPGVPTKESVMPSVERLLVASAPLQGFFMTARRIYRWDEPEKTAWYLVAFLIVWGCDMILPVTIGFIVYTLLDRWVNQPSLDNLRKDIKRTEDINEAAFNLTEFIEKEGQDVWMNRAAEKIGPWLMIQLGDIANLVEIVRNFYEWRRPHRTAFTVLILSIACIATVILSLSVIVRASTLGMALTFFFLYPISSRYPDYRLLASPVQWLFWKIPTHAEWAITSLQAKGKRFDDNKLNNSKATPLTTKNGADPLGYRGDPVKPKEGAAVPEQVHSQSQPDTMDYGHYKCHYDGAPGKLVVMSNGVRFETSRLHPRKHTEWKLKWNQIAKMEKETRHVTRQATARTGEDLKFVTPKRHEFVCKDVVSRDQTFSQIIGYSDVKWQVRW